MSAPSREEILDVLEYCPASGKFTWKVDRGGTAWAGTQAGAVDGNGYTNIRFNGRLFKAHRLAWLVIHGVWPSHDIDHINRDKSDNRIVNLRLATDAQNVANSTVRRDNRCGLKGVSQRGRKYIARITKNKTRVVIGLFLSKEEAHSAYLAEAQKYFGQYARSA